MAGVMSTAPHGPVEPSQWVARWAASIRPGGSVLDVAAGSGRHAKLLARMGFEVEAVDRDLSAFVDAPPNIVLLEADIESGSWPYEGWTFDGIVVTTTRTGRPAAPRRVARAGGLPYETFAQGNERRQAFESGVLLAPRVAGGRARATAGPRLRRPWWWRAAAGGDPRTRRAGQRPAGRDPPS